MLEFLLYFGEQQIGIYDRLAADFAGSFWKFFEAVLSKAKCPFWTKNHFVRTHRLRTWKMTKNYLFADKQTKFTATMSE